MSHKHNDSSNLSNLLQETTEVLANPLSDPSNPKYQPVVSLLSQMEFFQKTLAPSDLEEFVQIAKFYVGYEVYKYGSIIMNEKEAADKLFLVLKGSAKKLDAKIDLEGNKSKSISNSDEDCQGDFFKTSQGEKELKRETGINKEKSPASSSLIQDITPVSANKIMIIRSTPTNNSEFRVSSEVFSAKIKSRRRRRYVKTSNYPSLGILDGEKSLEDSLSPKTDENSPNSLTWVPSPMVPSTLSIFGQMTLAKSKDNVEDNKVYEPKDKVIEEEDIFDPNAEEHAKFVKDLAAINPKIACKCLNKGDVCLVSTETYNPGDCFGENFNKVPRIIEKSIIAAYSETVHLLVITREHYKLIIDEISKRKSEKTDIFDNLFPSSEKETLQEFAECFAQKKLKTGEQIYGVNEFTDGMYIVKTGKVILMQEVKAFTPQHKSIQSLTNSDRPEKTEMPLITMTKGQLFGEEVLVNEKYRKFTALAAVPNTEVYFLKNSSYNRIKNKFTELFNSLRDLAQNKIEWHDKKASEIVEQQKDSQVLEGSHSIIEKQSKNLTFVRTIICFDKESTVDVRTPSAFRIRFESSKKKAGSVERKRPVDISYLMTKSPQTPSKSLERNKEKLIKDECLVQTPEKEFRYSFSKIAESPKIRLSDYVTKGKVNDVKPRNGIVPKLKVRLPNFQVPLSQDFGSFSVKGDKALRITKLHNSGLEKNIDNLSGLRINKVVNKLAFTSAKFGDVFKAKEQNLKPNILSPINRKFTD